MSSEATGGRQLYFINEPFPPAGDPSFQRGTYVDASNSFASDTTASEIGAPALFVPDQTATVYVPDKPTKPTPAPRGRKRKEPPPITPNPIQDLPVPQSQQRGRHGDPPQSMTGQIKLNLVGHGRGRLEDNPPPLPVLGKGRAARQGTRIQIDNPLRQQARAEEKAKRRKFTDDDPPDRREEEELKRFATNDEDAKVVAKAKASEGSKTRAHHACDRCYRNKIRCTRKSDGKAPAPEYPCDYCLSLNAICSVYLAASKKPEAWILSEETDWKRYGFADLLNVRVEQENFELRKKLGKFEARMADRDKVLEAVKSELEMAHQHIVTLRTANESSISWARSREAENTLQKEKLRDLYRKNDYLRARVADVQANGKASSMGLEDAETGEVRPDIDDHEPPMSVAPSMSVGRILAFDENYEPSKPETSVDQALAIQESPRADPAAQESMVQSSEATRQDVFQGVRSGERRCNDIKTANTYVSAYFENVHPLLPVLHEEAFKNLYQVYGLKALADEVKTITDASTREGRAVTLICSVLALGALSMVKPHSFPQASGNQNQLPQKQLPHFGEALGFYVTCLRLLAYTHDTIETMIAYLLMGVFAVQTTDSNEGFRRFINFLGQATAINLARWLDKNDSGMIYDPELWPKVSNLIIFEMAKRAYSVFKFYFNNLCLELGRRPNLHDIDVERPKPVKDSYLQLNACTVAEYGEAPNPITFILSLQNLAGIVESYSELVFGRVQETFFRFGQLAKLRDIQAQIVAWERQIPSFLDWRNPANDHPPRPWMKMQRDYLESQYQCVMMKISWSTASLDPVLIAKLQSMWNGGDPYAEARNAARRVMDIVKESAATTKAGTFYHSDAVRAATLLLQTLLRDNPQDQQDKKNEVTATCRDALALSRSLVPSVLTKAEDTIEKLLDAHVARMSASSASRSQPIAFSPKLPSAIGSPILPDGYTDQFGPFAFPFDSTTMDSLFQNPDDFLRGPIIAYPDDFGSWENMPSNS